MNCENNIARTENKVNETLKQMAPMRIMGIEFFYLALLGIGFAALGWIVENLARFFINGTVDARFHILPFISPYGLIPFALHIVLRDPDDLHFFGKRILKTDTLRGKIISNIISFLLISAVVFLGELAVGNAWDHLFGVKLWNYSNMPLHVTQYTGIVSSLGFGLGAYLIFKFAYAPILRLIMRKVSYKTAKVIVMTLGTLIVLDTLRMMIMIIVFNEAPMLWRVRLR